MIQIIRKTIFILLLLNLLLPVQAQWYNSKIKCAEKQTRYLIEQSGDKKHIPRTYSNQKAEVEFVDIQNWTSGFFPGVLWLLHAHTNNPYWNEEAQIYTQQLAPIQHFTIHHDVGFMIMSSYGQGLVQTNDTSYRTVIVNTANALITRYRETAGTIQSWNKRISRTGANWECPVIIDNMMNLELLFKATEFTGNKKYYDIAIHHADNTMKNHVRPDYSSYHLVNYDLTTGAVTDRDTWQGFSRNSTWTRGQAWGIYGFTMCYRFTGEKKYLDTAVKMADFFLNHKNLPKDKIPFWDFNVGEAGYVPDWKYQPDASKSVLRDASAATIVASALLELSTFSDELRTKYFKTAEIMLQNLSSKPYFATYKSNGGFILKNSVGNLPGGSEIDVPLNYADYYYLEGLLRYKAFIKR